MSATAGCAAADEDADEDEEAAEEGAGRGKIRSCGGAAHGAQRRMGVVEKEPDVRARHAARRSAKASLQPAAPEAAALGMTSAGGFEGHRRRKREDQTALEAERARVAEQADASAHSSAS